MADYSEQYELKLQLEDDGIIEKLTGVKQALSQINKTTTLRVNTSGLNGVSSALNTISSGLSKISQHSYYLSQGFSSIGSSLSKISAVSLAPVVGGLTKVGSLVGGFVKDTIQYGMTVEQAQLQLEAQGVTGEKLKSTFQDITNFANVSPFDVANMTEAVSQVNAYVGNIDKAVKATKIFGTSLYASGRDASSLEAVARNLGQLDTGSFSKADYNELIKGVPAVSAALRDVSFKDFQGNLHQGISGWDDFLKAIGDNPDTQKIEKTVNALDLVTAAVEKYNIKTHAFEKSNASLTAKMGNMVGQFQTMRDSVLKSSGAYSKFTDLFIALSDKINSNETQSLLTNIFKASIPYMNNLISGIKNFNINDFITGLKNGFNTVKTTITGIADEIKSAFNFVQNLPFIGDFIKSLKSGLTGGQGDIGQFIGNWISAALKIGFTGIKFSFIGKGLNLFSTITQVLSSVFGGAGSIAKFISSKLSKEVSSGISTGINIGMSGANAATQAVNFSKVGSAVSGIGGGILKGFSGFAVGVVGLSVSNWIDAYTKTKELSNINKTIDIVNRINDEFPTLNNTDAFSELQSKIDNFVEVADGLANLQISGGTGSFNNAVSNLATTAGGILIGLSAIPGIGEIAMTTGGALVGVGLLNTAMQTLNEINNKIHIENENAVLDLVTKINNLPEVDISMTSGLSDKVKNYTDIAGQLENAFAEVGIGGGDTFTKIGSLINNWLDSQNIGAITSSLGKLSKLPQTINTIMTNVSTVKGQVKSSISALKTVVTDLATGWSETNWTVGKGGNAQSIFLQLADNIELTLGLSGTDTGGNQVQSNIDRINNALEKVVNLVSQIRAMTSKTQGLNVKGTIQNLFNAINQLNSDLTSTQFNTIEPISGPTLIGANRPTITTSIFSDLADKIDSLNTQIASSNIISKLQTLATNVGDIKTQISDTQAATTGLNTGGITNAISSLFTNFNSQLDSIITAVNIDFTGKITTVVSKMDILKTDIQILKSKMDEVNSIIGGGSMTGTTFGGVTFGSIGAFAGGVTGLSGAITGLGSASVTATGSVTGLTSGLSALGNIASSTNSKIQALIQTINSIPSSKTVTITAIDNATPTLRAIASYQMPTKIVTVSADVSAASSAISQLSAQASNIKPVTLATGGSVNYFAKGGSTFSNFFKPKGQDTIPAMLSQGEYVIRRSAANQLGIPMLDALNSGNLTRAYDFMSQRVANTVSSVRNYTTNYNNNAQIHQHFHNDAQQYNGYRNLRNVVRGI